MCGNGTLEPGEQCDDNNNVSGDGCSATCTTEWVPPPVPSGSRAVWLALSLGLLAIGAAMLRRRAGRAA